MIQLYDSAAPPVPLYIIKTTLLRCGPIEVRTMERAAATSHPQDISHFPGFDEDISTVRNVARKTFETLELNVQTCLKITKLVDAITSDQGNGLRFWSRSNSGLNLRRFKDFIDSLRRKEDA